METKFIQKTNSSNIDMLLTLHQEYIHEMNIKAVEELSKEVGRKIADKVFKENKKKIMSSVNLDLVIAEVEKSLLEKVKKHSSPTLTNKS